MVSNLRELLNLFFRDAHVLSDSLLRWRAFSVPGEIPDPASEFSFVRKLLRLLSMKGEDIMIHLSSKSRKPQKSRNTIPANLWRWVLFAVGPCGRPF